jgi:transcriptional activator SPT7
MGLEAELGLTSLSVPKKLLRGRRDNAANARYIYSLYHPSYPTYLFGSSTNREPPLPYPPPTPFIPIHTANLDSHIGLLHPFYASKAGAPPPDGGPIGAVLAEDPINSLKVKTGPLGQIVAVAAGAGKKKGGGGGGGGGSGAGTGAVHSGGPTDTNIKAEGSKTPKKKKAKAPPPVSTEPPLTMPNFSGNKVPPAAAPAGEVTTMMPDFSAFVSGVHAGV